MISSATYSLEQVEQILNLLNANQYKLPLELYSGSSIGQHVRHILELYNILIKAEENGFADYDSRERNKQLETDINFAKTYITQLKDSIRSLDLIKNIKMSASSHPSPEIPNPIIETNIERELLYNIEHTTHHLAIIKIGIKACFSDICIDENIGVAPATIKHKESCVQ